MHAYMNTKLRDYIRERVNHSSSVMVPISELERIAGEDWLLEVVTEAQSLQLRVSPHARDDSFVVIERES